jgi:hypothetical protein
VELTLAMHRARADNKGSMIPGWTSRFFIR